MPTTSEWGLPRLGSRKGDSRFKTLHVGTALLQTRCYDAPGTSSTLTHPGCRVSNAL